MFINLTNFLKNKFMARSRNQLMMKWSSEKLLIKERKKREKLRISENREHKIYYYHQVDDPYSILVLPLLKKIKLKYNIIIECILVGIPPKKTTPEPDMFQIHCLNDVRNIAPYYGQKKKINDLPKKKNVDIANYILSRCDKTNFIETASVLMEDLWFEKELDISKKFSIENFNLNETISIIKKGNLIRKKNGYYNGSSFYYEGESYWGIDRLNHLEMRLKHLGLEKSEVHEKIINRESLKKHGEIINNEFELTIYPSLNSPYTYICFPKIKRLLKKYNINMITKPVLPMLMRGMHIPRYKGEYILMDSAREGRLNGINLNKIYSPLGKPAELAYSLFPKINEFDKGFLYIEKLTIASFHDGINIGQKSFLKSLVDELNLPWEKIKLELGNNYWRKILENNLQEMYEGNCWGVPSFKLSDKNNKNPFYQWGQDRIWLIEEEIIKRSC